MSKWKVYISSTFKDLKDFRADLINLFQNQLKNSFELSEIMERMFDDGTYTPYVDDCIEAVKESHIYLIILGNRTGSYPPNEERTYTEIELDTALSNNKKIFCLRLEDFDEAEIDNKAKHDSILKKFEGRPNHTFKDTISLKNSIFEFLIQFASSSPEDEGIDGKIKDYIENEKFRDFMMELSENKNIQNYSNLPPYIIGNFIRVMDVDDRNSEYEKYRTIGDDRFWLINEYFYSYLNLSKYCILSILWDEIRSGVAKTPKEAVYELIINSKMNERNIETLSNLCDEIFQQLGNSNEKVFIENLIPSIELFKKGISVFEVRRPDKVDYWNSELLLQELMLCSKFLNHYQIRSIRARYYVRHRNDEREQYTLEYSNKRNELLTVSEEQVNQKFVNIHSLYLCEKDSDGDIVINLSPFYFDKNSHDQNAAKIKLFAFDRVIEDDGEVFLNYLPILNPRERGNTISNSNIAIGKNKITSEQLIEVESKDKKRKLERELEVHKINKLYEQFMPFLDVISEEHV